MRLLAIDDCLINRKLLSSFLSGYGQCDTADNGGLGLDLFCKACKSAEPYSLICLDISMPGMNGYETLDAIRKFEDAHGITQDARVKVLIITAFADEECLLKTYDKCQGYIIKPIRIPKLAEKLAALGMTPGEPAPQKQTPKTASAATGMEYLDNVPVLAARGGRFAVLSNKGEELDQAGLEYFKNVVMGQLVARLDKSAQNIAIGQGLYVGPDNISIFASESGRVALEGSRLKLEDFILFPRGLRESVDFVGRIEVEGDVSDGVSLRGTKGIVIRGEAGACELKSEGDVEVMRFNGNGRGSVKCGGSFSCDFLYGAKVEARGSVTVRREALNSEVKAADSFKAAVFSGGSCLALNRIEIGRAGAPNDPGTAIKAGVNFHLLDRKISLEKKMRDAESSITQIKQMLGPYAADIGLAVMLFEDKRRKIYEYSAELRRQEALLQELQQEYSQVKSIPHTKSDPVIAIEEVLHKGVKLSIGDLENVVSDDLKGPFAVSEQFIRL